MLKNVDINIKGKIHMYARYIVERGLIHPNEKTFQALTGIALTLSIGAHEAELTPGPTKLMYLKQFKMDHRHIVKTMQKSEQKLEHIIDYPPSPEGLKDCAPKLYNYIMTNDAPMPVPEEDSLSRVISSVPMRCSNILVTPTPHSMQMGSTPMNPMVQFLQNMMQNCLTNPSATLQLNASKNPGLTNLQWMGQAALANGQTLDQLRFRFNI